MNGWINIKKEQPTKDDYGHEFLCAIKTCSIFMRCEIADWTTPLCDNEEPMDESDMPYFDISYKTCGQQAVEREVTHWMRLPKLPKIIK